MNRRIHFSFLLILLAGVLGCATQKPVVIESSSKSAKWKPDSFAISPGYTLSEFEYRLKVLNGLAYQIKVQVSADRSYQYLLNPGGQIDIPFAKSYRGRGIIITAVVLEKGKIVGTASRSIRIPRYGSFREENVWHITSFQGLSEN